MNFKRRIYSDLLNWKNQLLRMPLILRGARQVGKTHLIRTLGQEFQNIYEFNFQKNPDLEVFFKTTNDPKKIIEHLGILSNKKINPETDLIFLMKFKTARKP